MNVCKLQLDPIIVSPNQVYYALKAFAHTILFNRICGIPITPKEIQCPLFDHVIYVQIDSKEIDQEVEQSIHTICKSIRNYSMIEIYIKLYSTITKYGFLGEYKENIEWERWSIIMNVSEPCHESKILERMNTILELCGKYQDHIPMTKNIGFSITPSIEKETSFLDMFRSMPQLLPGMS